MVHFGNPNSQTRSPIYHELPTVTVSLGTRLNLHRATELVVDLASDQNFFSFNASQILQEFTWVK